MKEIKFRAWDNSGEKAYMLGPYDLKDSIFNHKDIRSLPLMQFTGLKDKNGKEIYSKDLLRIKGTMGDNSQYKFDCIYLVQEIDYEGLSLSFVKLFSEEPDSVENSYPINQHPSFKYNSLCTDYINCNYDNIAFAETHGNNPTFRQTWKQHDHTNDIEVIGNIYEHEYFLHENKNGK